MFPRCVLSLAFLCSTAAAEVLEFDLNAAEARSVNFPSLVDDSHLAEPRGYAVHGARVRSVIQRIEVTNTGKKPLTGRILTVNDRDWTNFAGLQRGLGLSPEPERQAQTMIRLFSFWKDHRSHAGTDALLANEPFATLNFWGYTLCGEDTQSMARLAYACEIPARHVQLNGHLAAEYRYDGEWHVVDGDQNAVYLRLDNRTLASADDLRADPFLMLRTKVFGKHSAHELAASAFNSALLEHVNPAEPKPIKLKAGPAPLENFNIRAGETLVWHCDTPPELAVAKLGAEKADVLRSAALATIEHRAIAKNHRDSEGDKVAVRSPFPIWKVVNHATGEMFQPKPDQLTFKATLSAKSDADQISVFSQCSRVALPLLYHGDNTVKLGSETGEARVAVHYTPVKGQPPSAKVSARSELFQGPPAFTLTATPRADRVWWQVSETRNFDFVAPSLEGVIPWAAELRFDPMTETFLSPGRKYFLRVKLRNEGVWGNWSEYATFNVSKPPAPAELQFKKLITGKVRLTWKGAPGKNVEYLVFGSNRRDFVPDVFADEEIVAMAHTKVTERRENKNLLGQEKAPEFEFDPKLRYFRVIARRGTILSVPSALAEVPAEMAGELPPGRVLQVRASKEGSKDVYQATEQPLK